MGWESVRSRTFCRNCETVRDKSSALSVSCSHGEGDPSNIYCPNDEPFAPRTKCAPLMHLQNSRFRFTSSEPNTLEFRWRAILQTPLHSSNEARKICAAFTAQPFSVEYSKTGNRNAASNCLPNYNASTPPRGPVRGHREGKRQIVSMSTTFSDSHHDNCVSGQDNTTSLKTHPPSHKFCLLPRSP